MPVPIVGVVFGAAAVGGLVWEFFFKKHPVPPAPPAPPGVLPSDPKGAALLMAQSIAKNGYTLGDQPIYKNFQGIMALNKDGFPGTHTMGAMKTVLENNKIKMIPVVVFPWLNKPGLTGYDGVNAPLLSQWDPHGILQSAGHTNVPTGGGGMPAAS